MFGDFMNDVALRDALRGVDTVFHLVSTTFPGMTLESSVYDVLSNVLPTIRMLELCLASGVRKVVFASSGGAVYGEPDTMPIAESHATAPISAHGQSKLTIENYLSYFARTTALDVDILRISNPYGPFQNPFGIQGLVAVAMACAHNGRTLQILGKGEAIRDYIYIGDVVEGLRKAASHSGSATLNLSSGRGYSVIEVVEMIEAVSGRRIARSFSPARKSDVSANVLSNQRSADLLHWQPTTDFATGLRRTWDWVQTRLHARTRP
jgi:UDP-glucose 4-epimerase